MLWAFIVFIQSKITIFRDSERKRKWNREIAYIKHDRIIALSSDKFKSNNNTESSSIKLHTLHRDREKNLKNASKIENQVSTSESFSCIFEDFFFPLARLLREEKIFECKERHFLKIGVLQCSAHCTQYFLLYFRSPVFKKAFQPNGIFFSSLKL